jgi:hypothetical protein
MILILNDLKAKIVKKQISGPTAMWQHRHDIAVVVNTDTTLGRPAGILKYPVG